MGQDKALLKFGEETLLERTVRVVNPLVRQTVVMLSQELDLPEGMFADDQSVQIGRDKVKEQGPLQGLVDALQFISTPVEFIIVLSCDLPFISQDWLQIMLERHQRSRQFGIVCSRKDKYMNPLIASYRYSTLKKAQHLVQLGKRSCLALFDVSEVSALEPKGNHALVLSNINTPEEYERALQIDFQP